MGKCKSGRYADYNGTARYSVEHPNFGRTTVFAPDEESAMVAAADVWNTRWTRLNFYTQCNVYKM